MREGEDENMQPIPALAAGTRCARFPLVTSLCGRQDLNLHVFRHQDLNLARLPISPHPRASLLERIGALGIPDGASLHPRS